MVGSLILILLEFSALCSSEGILANPPRIDKVIVMVRVAPFVDSRCSTRYLYVRVLKYVALDIPVIQCFDYK